MKLYYGDCTKIELPMVDAIVTDPPYGLEFMGQEWDKLQTVNDSPTFSSQKQNPWGGGNQRVRYQAGIEMQQVFEDWFKVLIRFLKPGGYLLSFGGTRTYHRLVCALENVGFEIRDCLMWLYGTGFPKGKGCLKPGYEPIVLARNPGPEVVELGIEECRIGTEERTYRFSSTSGGNAVRLQDAGNGKGGDGRDLENARRYAEQSKKRPPVTVTGRWPANVVHDGSEEVLEAFAAFGERYSASAKYGTESGGNSLFGYGKRGERMPSTNDATGTAARFFYCAKASRKERGKGNTHPTVKPIALVEWLIKLVCCPNGLVLDPFMGSGTTGIACRNTGRNFIGIDKNREYCKIAAKRLEVKYKDRAWKQKELW